MPGDEEPPPQAINSKAITVLKKKRIRSRMFSLFIGKLCCCRPGCYSRTLSVPLGQFARNKSGFRLRLRAVPEYVTATVCVPDVWDIT